MSETVTGSLQFLKDLWDEKMASQPVNDPLELLRYRSNLLGADLRITNFAGGNTSSKIDLARSLHRKARARACRERQRRRFGIDYPGRIRASVSR